jgi:hypothetical protein
MLACEWRATEGFVNSAMPTLQQLQHRPLVQHKRGAALKPTDMQPKQTEAQ